jgi:hypothetical protein
VKNLTRIGPVAQTVAIPDAALLLGHKLTGARDLGVKRVQLEHTHDVNLFGRIAQFRTACVARIRLFNACLYWRLLLLAWQADRVRPAWAPDKSADQPPPGRLRARDCDFANFKPSA